MRYLVDANVLSEPTKPSPDARVVDWLLKHERQLVVDPIILGELRFGILLLPKGRRRRKLEEWFAQGVDRLNCLPWEVENARVWADLLARLRKAGKAMPRLSKCRHPGCLPVRITRGAASAVAQGDRKGPLLIFHILQRARLERVLASPI